METLNANAIYQKNFRNKKAEEKKRVEDLVENYSKLSPEILLKNIKLNVKKNIFVGEDKKIRAIEKYDRTQVILERIEFLAIALRMTAAADEAKKLEAMKKRLLEEEGEKHRSKIKKINKADSNSIFYLMPL